MEQRLSLVTLGVQDVGASRRFYSRGLGWEPLLDMEEVVFYQVGSGLALALFSLADLGADTGHPAVAGTPFTLAQNLDSPAEVDEAVRRARAAGATVLKEPQRAAFGGYHGYFADPDGHRWEVCHNPGWSVAQDGTVTLAPVDAPDGEG
ncbi:VOC family protein [Streptomyces somaliensis DSM 40738]|uniref:VOC family protein n=1 Tax=Streptomyces somaliensis (strain ATCC 33201 / DSM 40738 / JCM 12659 / KCTC 9044 / NCTC 11332 / NRRL B-12077 / IP 733) TaxID=1134445 RepID=A0AA44IBW3_STRE0|nr:VOC family protein [Streptomyces somaliensis]MCQ0021729.1 VOC family protein [Streptomyces somaliensis DSM 40738]NKY13045.1 VOC family protein [Streptomyces somaliensis DSM 40738]